MKKKWVRVVASIIFGGMITESILAYTGGKVEINSILIAIVLYFILTAINNSINGRTKVKSKKEDGEVLDDF